MPCSWGHPPEPRARLLPGLYRCLSDGHNELYYDGTTEPVATCSCGDLAITTCDQCRSYRCPRHQPAGHHLCDTCEAARGTGRSDADRERRLRAIAAVPDPVERLLLTAMILETDPAGDVYAWARWACPYLAYAPGMRFWEPLEVVLPPGEQPLPWDSAAIGRWFAGRAAAMRLPVPFQLTEGRLFARTAYGWRLLAGSSVRLDDGFTDTAFVLTGGEVVRAVAPEERHPGQIATRRTIHTGLNLLALAELGRTLRMRAPEPA